MPFDKGYYKVLSNAFKKGEGGKRFPYHEKLKEDNIYQREDD